MLLKKTSYVVAFAALGILVSTVIHAVIEIPMIALVTGGSDGIRWLPWSQWKMLHHIGAATLLLLGIGIGTQQGLYWWPKLYDKNGRVRRRDTR